MRKIGFIAPGQARLTWGKSQLRRGLVADGTVWADLVVLPPPRFTFCLCLFQGQKPRGIQAFPPKLAVEALDKAVVRGLSRPGKVQFNPVHVGPEVQGLADEPRRGHPQRIPGADLREVLPHPGGGPTGARAWTWPSPRTSWRPTAGPSVWAASRARAVPSGSRFRGRLR